MRTIAALLAALPLAAAAQDTWTTQPAPPPQTAQPAPPPQAAPPAPPPAQPAPAQAAPAPQAYPPPPQAAPPAPPPQYAPPPAYPPGAYPQPVRPPKTRDRWYIGFGLGTGDGSVKIPTGTWSFHQYLGSSPTQVFLNFKVGATLSPKLLLGFDITALRSAVDDSSGTYGAQITNYDAVVTWFPAERGFFLRGGLGISAFSYDEDSAALNVSTSTTGMNVLGGIGYAFWLGKQFNLTLNLDLSAQSYGDKEDPYVFLPDSSRFWAAWIGFDWY